ncbi:hypothetical protein Tco_0356985 [Tanacetum coccineum]
MVKWCEAYSVNESSTVSDNAKETGSTAGTTKESVGAGYSSSSPSTSSKASCSSSSSSDDSSSASSPPSADSWQDPPQGPPLDPPSDRSQQYSPVIGLQVKHHLLKANSLIGASGVRYTTYSGTQALQEKVVPATGSSGPAHSLEKWELRTHYIIWRWWAAREPEDLLHIWSLGAMGSPSYP